MCVYVNLFKIFTDSATQNSSYPISTKKKQGYSAIPQSSVLDPIIFVVAQLHTVVAKLHTEQMFEYLIFVLNEFYGFIVDRLCNSCVIGKRFPITQELAKNFLAKI